MTALHGGLRPRGLTWSVLTTHRTAFRLWAAYVVLAMAVLAGLYWFGQDLRTALDLCGTPTSPCGDGLAQATGNYRGTLRLVENTLVVLPVVVAAFAGAALIGREMENGTAALAWTQSVTPFRWLAAKLVLPALALAGGTMLLTLVYRWVRDAGGRGLAGGWHLRETYLVTGTTGAAYVLLGLAVGAVTGLLVRRTLPALGLGVAAVAGLQGLGFTFWGDLWPKVTLTGGWPLEVPQDARLMETGAVTASGERFGFERCYEGIRWPDADIKECLAMNDAEVYVVFHPASHYWPIQLVETGILLALTALLTAAAFRLLRRRLA